MIKTSMTSVLPKSRKEEYIQSQLASWLMKESGNGIQLSGLQDYEAHLIVDNQKEKLVNLQYQTGRVSHVRW